MLILRLISRLLDYPTKELFAAADELLVVVDKASELNSARREQIRVFIDDLVCRDLYDAQERYDLLFDRGRALSLLLFEHVHGESRDRGQAMVELMKVYNARGFDVDSSQLPDYIPLYLEFLSLQDEAYACEWLSDICHLLATLSERLINRDCNYSVLFDALIDVSGHNIARDEISDLVKMEERDDSMAVIDREWEDKEVRFDDPLVEQCPGSGVTGAGNMSEHVITRHVAVK
jgi:nitrate reductase delta subunit